MDASPADTRLITATVSDVTAAVTSCGAGEEEGGDR